MTDANNSQSEIIAKIAFFLLIGGVLVPLIITLLVFLLPWINLSKTSAENVALLAVGFGFLLEVLALVLGIFCRQHLFGKVAMVGASTLIVLSVLSFASLFTATATPVEAPPAHATP